MESRRNGPQLSSRHDDDDDDERFSPPNFCYQSIVRQYELNRFWGSKGTDHDLHS